MNHPGSTESGQGLVTITARNLELLARPGRLLLAHLGPVPEDLAHLYEPGAVIPVDWKQHDPGDFSVPFEEATIDSTVYLLSPEEVDGCAPILAAHDLQSHTLSQPFMITTTFAKYGENELLVGLHRDYTGGPRVAVNCGPGKRGVVIGRQPILSMAGPPPEGVDPKHHFRTSKLRQIATEAAARSEPLEALMLLLYPGEAYIANTGGKDRVSGEDSPGFFHDGSTLLGKQPSLVKFYIGNKIVRQVIQLL